MKIRKTLSLRYFSRILTRPRCLEIGRFYLTRGQKRERSALHEEKREGSFLSLSSEGRKSGERQLELRNS